MGIHTKKNRKKKSRAKNIKDFGQKNKFMFMNKDKQFYFVPILT